MFPHRFFGARFFAARYFGTGATATTGGAPLTLALLGVGL